MASDDYFLGYEHDHPYIKKGRNKGGI